MSAKPEISVIVPVYNVEKYLRQCVDSILSQTFNNLEVILVDDGSPDKCPRICDEYAAADSRVRVIHQPNGGLGKAYNVGIAAARGKYIGFVESDDWIEPDMYEELYRSAEKHHSDLVKCMFWRYDSQRSPADLPYKSSDSRFDLENCTPENKSFTLSDCPEIIAVHPSVWAALYKAELAKSLLFEESGSASYQDLSYAVKALIRAERISSVHKRLLHYRKEAGDNSSTMKTDGRLLMIVYHCCVAQDFLRRENRLSRLAEIFYLHAVRTCLHFYFMIDYRYKREYFRQMCAFAENMKKENLTYKYFSGDEKYFIRLLFEKRFYPSLLFCGGVYRRRLGGISFLKLSLKPKNKVILSLLGIPLVKLKWKRKKQSLNCYLLGVKVFCSPMLSI